MREIGKEREGAGLFKVYKITIYRVACMPVSWQNKTVEVGSQEQDSRKMASQLSSR